MRTGSAFARAVLDEMQSYRASQMSVDASLGRVTTIEAEVVATRHAMANYPSYFGDPR